VFLTTFARFAEASKYIYFTFFDTQVPHLAKKYRGIEILAPRKIHFHKMSHSESEQIVN
jgi:hypothetical protein